MEYVSLQQLKLNEASSGNNYYVPFQDSLELQLDLAYKELDMYRTKCSKLENDRKSLSLLNGRLQVMEKDIAEITGNIQDMQ